MAYTLLFVEIYFTSNILSSLDRELSKRKLYYLILAFQFNEAALFHFALIPQRKDYP
jgi:hypothetical protein